MARPPRRALLGLDQERLWVLQQMRPGSTTFHISFGLHIRGALDIGCLTEAIARVVARHDSLRAVVAVEADGTPALEVRPAMTLPVHAIDLRNGSAAAIDQALRSAIDGHVKAPFDLSRGPLLRVLVARIGEDDHHIVETAHHSVTDRWSYVQFNREVFGFYTALVTGTVYTPPALPIQFADFAARQRRWLADQGTAVRAFWQRYLDGAPAVTRLPYDAAPTTEDRSGAHCSFVLDDAVARGLIAYARRVRMTLNTALLGAYAALLVETTGQREVIIGLPSVTRSQPDTVPLIGFLLTNIPIRIRIPEPATLADVMRAARSARMAVMGYEETPFSEIIAAAAPKRTTDQYPFIQTMLFSLEFEEEVFDYPDGAVSITEILDGVSPNDITLGFWKAGDSVHGRLEYRTALFHPTTIEGLARRLLAILAALADGRDDALVAPPDGVAPAVVAAHAPPSDPPPFEGSGDGAGLAQKVPPPTDGNFDALEAAWRQVLRLVDVDPSDDFFDLGGNSLLAFRLTKVLRERGYHLHVRDIFAAPTFAAMAGALSAVTPAAPAPDMPTARTVPASPEQRRFLDSDLDRPELWAHSVVLDAAASVDPGRLRLAVERVIAAHPALTARVRQDGGSWVTEPGVACRCAEVAASMSEDDLVAAHRQALALGDGPLFQATVTPGATPRLILTGSHLVIDGWSWGLLEDRIVAAYADGTVPSTTADPHFDVLEATRQVPVAHEVPFWRDQVAAVAPLSCLLAGRDHVGGEREHQVLIPLAVPPAHAEAEVITAVARAVLSSCPSLVVDIVGLGREPLPALPTWDPMAAIGNYACVFPLHLPIAEGTVRDACDVVRGRLRAVPFGGKGYGRLRHPVPGRDAGGADPGPGLDPAFGPDIAPPLSINYVGRLRQTRPESGGVFTARRDHGPVGNADATRGHTLEVEAGISPQGIVMLWKHNPKRIAPSIVATLAEAAAENLRALLNHGAIETVGGRVGLSQAELNAHLDMLCRRTHAATGVDQGGAHLM